MPVSGGVGGRRSRLGDVGQADQGEGGQTVGHLHLHVDGQDVDALKGDGGDVGDHESSDREGKDGE
jgi:hypothetical protein